MITVKKRSLSPGLVCYMADFTFFLFPNRAGPCGTRVSMHSYVFASRVVKSAGELVAFGIIGQTKVWFAEFDSKTYRKVSDHEYYRRQY